MVPHLQDDYAIMHKQEHMGAFVCTALPFGISPITEIAFLFV